MVSAMKLTALGLLLLGSAAFAGSEERIDAYLAKGEKALAAVREVEGAKVLRALEAAKPHFRRARALAAQGLEGAPGAVVLEKQYATATRKLVAILNAETAIYLNRGALSLAKKRNGEALALLPNDARAKALADAVMNPAPYEFDAQLVDGILGSAQAGKPAARTEADRRFSGRR
jgi:hypothetical protein